MNINIHKWDLRFLELAKFVSNWSKDPSTQVGAVITDTDNRVVSVGYNGFPKNVLDDPDMLNDRPTKYNIIVHGEMNAILFANKSLKYCTLYTYPFMPCPRCSSMIIQSGISRVVSYKNVSQRWEKDFELSRWIFQQANIELVEYNNE
jgi:dCMP deaminase